MNINNELAIYNGSATDEKDWEIANELLKIFTGIMEKKYGESWLGPDINMEMCNYVYH